ncbi:hypothetical protein TrVE_jg1437 [Triparma verrucosa]|uniref:Uncharacterized protein n=1 Tax=Triparma verrucosa TaxID=1606542 RepID=A0A9W7CIU3_9STRA|nr:hypothetical protein TrVE_jg1437 [Triparma verrucosa]
MMKVALLIFLLLSKVCAFRLAPLRPHAQPQTRPSRYTFPPSPKTFSNNDHLGLPKSKSKPISNLDIITQAQAQAKQAAVATLTTNLITLAASPASATAASIPLSTGAFDPSTFKPVCSASDGFYRVLQGSAQTVIGPENYVEYGPLIAGGLLRIRLELCVVESFFNEAVVPFIKQNGVSWILPLHETVETFVAGTIFALATTFIMVGSTKLITVVVTYADLFVGGPCRLLGNFFFDRAQNKPVTFDVGLGPFQTRLIGPQMSKEEKERAVLKRKGLVKDDDSIFAVDLSKVDSSKLPVVFLSGLVKGTGDFSLFVRETTESLDLFVGRYLVLLATSYIGLKFVHFKLLPDLFPF